MQKRLCVALTLALLAMSGCSTGKNSSSLGGGGGTTTTGQLYVATNTAILRFDNALAVSGNVTPVATITGAATTLSSPEHLLVDITANRLFIANPGASSVLIYESASTVNGNAAPSRTISGAATLLAVPHDLALDATNNLLYVADGSDILVFQSASTVNGNTPPVHNISMGFAVGAILVDEPNNRLYVANTAGNTIDRLEGANTQDGPAVIGGSITGTATLLAHPQGLALDIAGRLIVSNGAGPSITIYSSPAAANGNVAPVASISGPATQMAGPDQIALNPNTNSGEVNVADHLGGAILVFSNLAAANGNAAPSRSISGAQTGLVVNGVNGVALDSTR